MTHLLDPIDLAAALLASCPTVADAYRALALHLERTDALPYHSQRVVRIHAMTTVDAVRCGAL